MTYAGKPVVLGVVRTERQAFYDLIDDVAHWEVQTRCTEWQTRDIVGHMIDVTAGYLLRWEIARMGESSEALGCSSWAKSTTSVPKHSAACRGRRRSYA